MYKRLPFIVLYYGTHPRQCVWYDNWSILQRLAKSDFPTGMTNVATSCVRALAPNPGVFAGFNNCLNRPSRSSFSGKSSKLSGVANPSAAICTRVRAVSPIWAWLVQKEVSWTAVNGIVCQIRNEVWKVNTFFMRAFELPLISHVMHRSHSNESTTLCEVLKSTYR